MDENFWHQRWQANQIAFHESEANSLLIDYFDKLALSDGARVFVPLCGKTLDISWLLLKGYQVVGVELSELAIKQLFEELKLDPVVTDVCGLKRYSARHVDIYVGDIFKLNRSLLGNIEAIYDRAAYVALPESMREKYARHVTNITNKAQQLLITFEYDQNLLEPPPFSISTEEIFRQFEQTYEISALCRIEVPGGLKGKCAANEIAWHLKQYSNQ